MTSTADVLITKVAIDETGRILLYPDLPAGRDFEHIYRAASGAYWDSSERALFAADPATGSYPDRFSHIVGAAASEYGCSLSLAHDVVWSNVPADIQEQILARHPHAA